MNILVLCNNYPATTRMPGSPRTFNLCRELAQAHDLILALFPRSVEKRQMLLEDPDNVGVFQEIIELPLPEQLGLAPPSWLRRQLHRLFLEPHFSQLKRYPGYAAHVRHIVNGIIRRFNIDLVFIDRQEMCQFCDFSEVPAVVDLCDCLAYLFAQQAKLAKRPHRRLALALESLSIAAWERRAAYQANLAVVISDQDEYQLRRIAPAANTLVVPNGIDVRFFTARPGTANTAFRPCMIFTGVMNYGPNADAALFFAETIFPLIRAQFPAAEFWIVGASPPPQLQRLAGREGLFVTGRVPDIREALEAADVFVCPLRYGTGMKNKILAALAMEVPVIATTLSLAGLPAKPEEHVLAADSPAEFLAMIRRLASDEALRERLKTSGRELVSSQCAWDGHAELLRAAMEELIPRRGETRRRMRAAL